MPRPRFPAAFLYRLPQFIRSRITPLARSGYSLDFPNGQISGGGNRAQRAVDLQTLRAASSQIASGNDSFLAGVNNTASATNIAVMGLGNVGTGNQNFRAGAVNTGTATQIFTAGFGNNSGSGTEGFLSGSSNTRTGSRSIVMGQSCTVSSDTIAAGFSNTASGITAIVFGNGSSGRATDTPAIGRAHDTGTGAYAGVFGGYRGNGLNIQGFTVFPASVEPISNTLGRSQSGRLVLGRETTNATTTLLTSNSTTTAAASNSLTLLNNSAVFFYGEIIANVTGGGNTKQWDIEGVIKRGATAGSTALVGTPTVTSNYADAGASTWTVAISANTTLGCLTINVTGQASTTIRWVCSLNVTQVLF